MSTKVKVVLQRDYKGHKAGETIEVDANEYARMSSWNQGVDRGAKPQKD